MSAIAGVYYRDERPVRRTDLERMVDTLAHRGGDGAGVWCQGAVGLGHQMLWTTPEARAEPLPLVRNAGSLVLTADARIDNREELRRTLNLCDQPAATVSDAALILHAYEWWGEQCPQRLEGDFAFAIWDGARQALFCARDCFGVKPFYYTHLPGNVFGFATEIKALLQLPGAAPRLNELRVAYYLDQEAEDKAITFYRDVFRLPPASWLRVDRSGMRVESYWTLDPGAELRLRTDDAYAEAFRETFTEAVRCRLRSCTPVGAMLSGGLDSSSIACTARTLSGRAEGHRLHTFSAIFDDLRECDERVYIRAVLDQGGMDAHYVHADRLSPLTDWEREVWHEDEPGDAPNLFVHRGLYQSAHRNSVRVLFDGFGGDSTVSHGLPYLAELAFSGRWPRFAVDAWRLARRLDAPYWRVVVNHGVKPVAPEPVRRAWRAMRRLRRATSRDSAASFSPVIDRGFAHRVALADHVRALSGVHAGRPRTAREYHFRELTSGVYPGVLEEVDRAAGALRVEPRYPFFDRRVAELCLALPPDQKLRDGWCRAVMRRAMAGELPTAVQRRVTKANWSANFRHGLFVYDRHLIDHVLDHGLDAVRAYVDVDALRRAYRRFVAHQGERDALTVCVVVTLALWLQRTSLAP